MKKIFSYKSGCRLYDDRTHASKGIHSQPGYNLRNECKKSGCRLVVEFRKNKI